MTSRQPRDLARVFGDSSVLFAASLSATGRARDLVLAALRQDVAFFLSDLVLEETERNLARKAPTARPAFAAFRQLLAGHIVNPTKTQVLRAAAVVELKDAPIVAGAVRARARYLATYDRRHLLSRRAEIEAAFGIVVATPDDILTAVQRGGETRP